LRRLSRETTLAAEHLIAPLFVMHGQDVASEVASMPGVFQLSVDAPLEREVDRLVELGIPAVILFGLPATKDEIGSENFAADGIVQRALRRLRTRYPDLLLITDVCCCEYTSHGHCGIVKDGTVDNDATLGVLGRVAVSHAEAGADVVAPSGMMDGMVRTIRAALDAAGFQDRSVLSYAVKYASAFYGPFLVEAESARAFGFLRQYEIFP
jgi:porphobilinogen synthase